MAIRAPDGANKLVVLSLKAKVFFRNCKIPIAIAMIIALERPHSGLAEKAIFSSFPRERDWVIFPTALPAVSSDGTDRGEVLGQRCDSIWSNNQLMKFYWQWIYSFCHPTYSLRITVKDKLSLHCCQLWASDVIPSEAKVRWWNSTGNEHILFIIQFIHFK